MVRKNICAFNGRVHFKYLSLEFNNDTNPDPHAKISVGRQTSLSFMFGYNDSDWTHGWMAAFDGFTVFYSEPNEETIDPLYSVALSSSSVPMLSVKQTMTELLGAPYNNNCLRDGHKLKERISLLLSDGI